MRLSKIVMRFCRSAPPLPSLSEIVKTMDVPLEKVFPVPKFSSAKLVTTSSSTAPFKLEHFSTEGFAIQLDSTHTLDTIRQKLLELDTELQPIKFMSDDRVEIYDETPVQVFVGRMFYIATSKGTIVVTSGSPSEPNNELIPNALKDLEFSVMMRHDVEEYIKRIDMLCELNYGKPLLETEVLTKTQMEKLLIEGLVDYRNWMGETKMPALYRNWEDLYWRVHLMQKMEEQVAELSRNKARRVMALGLLGISANMALIGFGTYVFYSWDIIEPIAYFIASGTSIILARQFMRMKKAFSYQNYLNWLAQKYMVRFEKKTGFDREIYNLEKKRLKILEDRLKDYMYIRL